MKILTLDIETSPHESYAWQVWQANIAPGQIIRPTCMLTWAAKWLGDKKTEFRTWTDADFHECLHSMLDEADMIVGYNHDKFDMRHINREFVERGFARTRPTPLVDLLKVVKANFNFPHNRLDYVCKVLLGESKLETGGFDLWPAFIAGDVKAEALMKKYNIRDVVLTEQLYVLLRGWIRNHPYTPAVPAIDDGAEPYQCPTCQSHDTERKRPRRTRCFAIRVVACNSCGTWFDGRRKKVS